ncbi:HlyD family type I secretion periplasmic adaptor subunit [Pseudomonas viridiflava]|jgi:type I secretion membrane fusion protein, HlyD family|uniref:HlyD family type I secretion periplasmic adaptor subunit n=1 Tax=Pseudomonas viridiflava TaxID=33069 RepID=UPI00201BC26D|nr:HlyD family type I secretion periplasmic adaptor subunit [Pseudomonas viridiflava]
MQSSQHDMTPVPAPDADAAGIARIGIWCLILGLGGFFLWAGLAPLDRGVVGAGTVVVSGERKTVQSRTGGMIDRILVREGDQVQQGQVVVQLNIVQTQSQLDVALGQWLSARAVEERLMAERLDRDSIQWSTQLLEKAGDPRARAAMELQGYLFATRRAELASRMKISEHEITSLTQQLAGYEEIKRNHAAQFQFQQQELKGLRELAREGYLPRNRLFEAESNAAQLGAQLASTLSDIGRTRQAINESKLKALQQGQIFRSEAESQLTQVSAQTSSLTDQIKAFDFEVHSASVVAPVAGQVMGLAVHTVGGIAPAGQRLMDIVPQGSSWVVKAQFPPMMADRLKPGLPVDLRFGSLQRVHTPVIVGQVATVSADQLIDEHTNSPYFSVEVSVSPKDIIKLRDLGLDIKPGMQAEVLVKTGERTLANYLMQPVSERMAGAFKEE